MEVKIMSNSTPKICLVSLQKDDALVPPVGLVHLATYLNEVNKIPKENIKVVDKNFDEVEKEIANFNPDIVGISAMTVHYEEASRLATLLKQRTKAIIVLGGVHISTLPESFRTHFDLGVIGEGEEPLSEIVSNYSNFEINNVDKIGNLIFFDIKGKLIINPIRKPLEIDTLPIPDYDYVNGSYFKKTEMPNLNKVGIKGYVISSRGCPYRCVFCSTSRFWGPMRMHSAEYVGKLIRNVVNKYRAEYIFFMDDLFAISPQRLNDVRAQIEKDGTLAKIEAIDSTARANLMSEELCQAMKSIKIKTINFGFESGSNEVIKYLKVGSSSVELNKKAIVMGVKNGFKVIGSVMYGVPNEKIEDMKKTNEFLRFALDNGASNVWTFVATPYPATPFWDIALKKGVVSNSMNFDNLSLHTTQRPLLLDEEIKFDEFNDVFSQGRTLTRKFKIRLVKNFVVNNPFKAVSLVIGSPRYWVNRIFTQLIKR